MPPLRTQNSESQIRNCIAYRRSVATPEQREQQRNAAAAVTRELKALRRQQRTQKVAPVANANDFQFQVPVLNTQHLYTSTAEEHTLIQQHGEDSILVQAKIQTQEHTTQLLRMQQRKEVKTQMQNLLQTCLQAQGHHQLQ